MHRPFFLSLGALFIAAAVMGQDTLVRWTRAEGVNQQLPFSITVFLTQDSVHGRPFRAVCVSIDAADQRLDIATESRAGRRLTPSEYFRADTSPKPFIVVGAGFFDPMDSLRPLGLIMRDRRLLADNVTGLRFGPDSATRYHYVTPSAFGINEGRLMDVGWVFTDAARDYPLCMLKGPSDPRRSRGTDPNPSILRIHPENLNRVFGAKCMQWPMVDATGGGPALVKRGQVYVASREEVLFRGRENELHPRTALGYTRAGRMIIVVIEGGHPGEAEGATLLEEAVVMKDLGCWEAMNAAGDAGSSLLINGRETIRPSGPGGTEGAVPAVWEVKSHL